MVRALTAGAIALLLAFGPARAAEEATGNDAGITKEFHAAVELLETAAECTNAANKQKKFELARIALEKVLSMRPGAKLARRLRNDIKEQLITQIFLQAPKETLSKVKEFLSIAELGRREWLRDQSRIAELIKDVTGGQFDEMWVAIYKLKAAGQHAAKPSGQPIEPGELEPKGGAHQPENDTRSTHHRNRIDDAARRHR